MPVWHSPHLQQMQGGTDELEEDDELIAELDDDELEDDLEEDEDELEEDEDELDELLEEEGIFSLPSIVCGSRATGCGLLHFHTGAWK